MARAAMKFWAVDRVMIAYLAGSCGLIAAFYGRVPDAGPLLAVHIAGIGLIAAVALGPQNRAALFFRHWYPLPYVSYCYHVMSILIPAIRGVDLDRETAALDFALWGGHPSVWLERIQTPALTEFLEVVYALFVPAVLVPAFVFWRRRRYLDFQYFAFLIALGYLVSYVGYFLIPVRGPRFFMRELQHSSLTGLWLFQPLQRALDMLESAHYDCFPSGHTELTLLAWWSSRKISRALFRVFFVYALCIISATVYLRYHYTVDVLAGALVAAGLWLVSPKLYKYLGSKRPTA